MIYKYLYKYLFYSTIDYLDELICCCKLLESVIN